MIRVSVEWCPDCGCEMPSVYRRPRWWCLYCHPLTVEWVRKLRPVRVTAW